MWIEHEVTPDVFTLGEAGSFRDHFQAP
jgi:hypothetical protein